MSHPLVHRFLIALPLAASVAVMLLTARVGQSQVPAARGDGKPTTVTAEGTNALLVVELFTSEGCSSCPPADELMRRLAAAGKLGSVPVLPVVWHVDYWNKLGWADPWSSPEATGRQRAYGARFGLGSIYTPQAVLNGTQECVGSNGEAIAKLVPSALRAEAPLWQGKLLAKQDEQRVWHVAVESPEPLPAGAELLMLVTRDGLESQPTRGENIGLLLRHVAAVVAAAAIQPGESRDLTQAQPGDQVVVLLTDGSAGPILQAWRWRLPQ